ncbi:PREDICTED: ALK tyrosine kinase receptor isoform X2 [Dinoponera quadriceps]|uniref:Tyrosine-protein kinase receptor n=1 Tax=Dinoponera quadriceps TaxID=609295 RepID=A0A6P3YI44_DINQU|nr:PREDICTED: ALK tyrosine kinase receptor isoform X2 [Dinoponera quadriceps]
MIRNTRLVGTAGDSRPSHTCDRRHVLSSSSGAGGSLLRIVALSLCCVMATCGDFKDRTPRSIQDLKNAMKNNNLASLGECDLEPHCDWRWNQTRGFQVIPAPARSKFGPITDANNSENGHFLWYSGSGTAQMWSSIIPPTSLRCTLELWMHQVAMEDGAISLVIDTNNVSSVTEEKYGNNNARWENMRFFLGAISRPYRLFLEILLPYANSSVAVDNVHLVNCFPDTLSKCRTDDMFRCKNGTCLSSVRICDFVKDCPDGEDETFECDKIPGNARCNFEDGWCGWANVPGRPLNWTLRSGSPPEKTTSHVPIADHTYRNQTGTYAYAQMNNRVAYGSRATIESPLYNPTPPYSSDSKNPYYQTCQIRFFFHKYGMHSSSFALYLVQIRRHGNQSNVLWWSYGKGNKMWENAAISLPDIRYRYVLQFEASKGYSKNDMAIDDISLSRECFGIGVPADIVGNFNYYNPNIELETVPPQHSEFANETVIRITTCGATGRKGPTAEQCADEYNGTDVELIVPSSSLSDQEVTSSHNLNGMQRWTAPRGEYYTLIAVGARGGMGSGGMGSTFGALVRGVIELQKGDQLYFMVGQEGTDACAKSLGMRETCRSSDESHGSSASSSTSAKVREVKKIVFKYGGGGGGGATAVFILKSNGELEPIMIAGGGGGLGSGQFKDDGLQHGRGPVPEGSFLPSSYEVAEGTGGPGASWNGQWSNNSDRQNAAGMSLVRSGLGGIGCEPGEQGHSNGGFGGGGGGCQTGGGGGGYIGGNSGRKPSGNGEGGYSYISQKLTDTYFKAATHYGPGEVFIISAISGCNCDYRCVVLDQYLSETKCLCPQGWLLSNNSKSCIMTNESKSVHSTYMIPLIVVSSLLVIVGIGLILSLLHRRQMILGNGTELTALHAMSGTLITEFNPNYEFAGNLYSFKDLPQIPRECISLTRPLGQGAFGEVHEGQYKYRRGQHPVAVKTLLTLSTPQAEADFMMEALIMSKFNHTNIVHFIGVCFDKHPKYIVLELLAGGDLKNFLREERPRRDRSTTLTMRDLVMCSFDVANGCKYMEETRFIHRDIAARNCLLTTKGPGRIVKIADFGMARDIYRGDYYRKGAGTVLPIKWMSPESLFDGIYTTKSDVWSFGVLLWEIMSFGYTPYIGLGNQDVIKMVKTGGRLGKPVGCPDPIYGIMMKCWRARPERRPNFSNIVERIGYCLQDPDVVCGPTPKYDVLPTEEGEITMWPDPEAECINVQSDLDVCGYVRPRVIDPRSVAHHVNQAVAGGTVYDAETEKSNRSGESHCRAFARSTECRQGKFGCNACDPTDTFERIYSGDDHDDGDDEYRKLPEITKTAGERKGKHQGDRPNRPDPRTIHRSENIEERDNRINEENGNNRPEEEEECHLTANTDSAMTDRRNGNESTTTTDTNSDSLIVQSSDTPPNTTTNSSPNTRTCSPSRVIGLNYANVNNANGMAKKSTLKATLSLDPSALYRGAIPYEKITRHTQRSSTPGSMELRKDSLSHELPREEECSC